MNRATLSPIEIERANERLRQERVTFEQRKSHDQLWFMLRLTMSITAITLLSAIMVVATYIIIHHETFPGFLVSAAGIALFTDVLGLLVAVWKIVLNPESVTKLEPVTEYNDSFSHASDEYTD